MTTPVAFHEFPAKAFPFTIDYIRQDTGEVVRTDVVDGPGVVQVPPASKEHQSVVIGVRVTYGDGTVDEYWPGDDK